MTDKPTFPLMVHPDRIRLMLKHGNAVQKAAAREYLRRLALYRAERDAD